MKSDTLGLSVHVYNAIGRYFRTKYRSPYPGRRPAPPEWLTDTITPEFLRAVPDHVLGDARQIGPKSLAEIRRLYPYTPEEGRYDPSGWLMELAP